ncbi:uncharacterized protein A1O5_02857 [Cladophialophora psammophila CBS 110553]|uniref:Uncharacterized protein n=1 Tax=Cladophialophora psammophila CBS 110553 TaxID=1182543 RepID=W9XC99_9EURO|nr:uncharacterized protein A1O5_02857 [Cladophialophora psammophila CBS 110553]EXJ74561.1 hypothetical protein A1O5_02857 [Cladophialophora psammophila CBS 110553]
MAENARGNATLAPGTVPEMELSHCAGVCISLQEARGSAGRPPRNPRHPLRRHKVFDRGFNEPNAFGTLLPKQFLSIKTPTPKFKFHKKVDEGPASWRISHEQPSYHSSTSNQSQSHEPYPFPDISVDAEGQAMVELTESISAGYTSPSPYLYTWLALRLHSIRSAVKIKRKTTRRPIDAAVANLPPTNEEAQKSAKTAVEYLIFRDFAWGLLYLAEVPSVQDKLRDRMRSAFGDAAPENRPSTLDKIVKTSNLYLQAVIEEIPPKFVRALSLPCSSVILVSN